MSSTLSSVSRSGNDVANDLTSVVTFRCRDYPIKSNGCNGVKRLVFRAGRLVGVVEVPE